eukprot:EG_transcript_27581
MGCKPSKKAAPAVAPSQEEVLFFPDQKLPCKFHYETQSCKFGDKCRYTHAPTNLTRFCDKLKGAQKSIDICVFNITCDFITKQVIEAHKRGVKVRIISDNAQAQTQHSDIPELRSAGIPVRTDKSPALMHHKFCVIDGKLLLNGSFNWTMAAVTSNAENVVINWNPGMVKSFAEEFEKLWQLYAG